MVCIVPEVLLPGSSVEASMNEETCRRGEQGERQQCRPRSPRHPLLLAENANYGDEMKPNIVVNHTSNLGVKSIKMLRDSKCHWFSQTSIKQVFIAKVFSSPQIGEVLAPPQSDDY